MGKERVSAYMTQDFAKIKGDVTVKEALEKMIAEEVETLIVIDAHNHHMVGMLSEVDIMHQYGRLDFSAVTVQEIARKIRTLTVYLDDFMEDAMEIFLTYHNIDQIIVEDRQIPVGVVRKIDVLRWITTHQV
jgi:predicted transcriptional regulator